MKQKAKKKKDSQENVKVDPEIKAQVKSYCDEAGMKIGRFYDLAAKKELQFLTNPSA